jgi:hypothetical protein
MFSYRSGFMFSYRSGNAVKPVGNRRDAKIRRMRAAASFLPEIGPDGSYLRPSGEVGALKWGR